MKDKLSISVVVPVFQTTTTLEHLVNRLKRVLSDKDEIILVDDGSSSATWETIRSLSHCQITGLRLSRNFGQHSALLAGIREANNDVIITMDDDLQNPPEEIPKLIERMVDGTDVVYGLPKSIGQNRYRRFVSRAAKLSLKLALGFEHAMNISSFRVFRTQLRDGFAENLGPGVSIDALLNWSTTRFASVEVEHRSRESGKSNYSFWKLLRFMFDTATGYSTAPLRAATGLGIATVLFSIGVLVWVVGRPLVTGESVPGFPFLAATIAIFSGTQLIVLGVLGQYLGRMHFRVMKKPTYTIAERIGT
jgi:undecaprenyl-phosphate 4-deoxy-4-formamido-L-arabinose transferase